VFQENKPAFFNAGKEQTSFFCSAESIVFPQPIRAPV
jgi:hypothetical protein